MARIAVITPYYQEDTAILAQCHHSVRAQGVDADHFLVADGFPNPAVAAWTARHVPLPSAHGDNGNTPRAVGHLLADAEGYDFIAYLDADNWFHDGHLASLLALHERTGASVCASLRTFHALDGALLDAAERDENDLQHVDTSCYLLHRSAFSLGAVWSRMPRPLGPICDRVFLAAVRKERFQFASTRQRTVAFRSQYELHYRAAGVPVPPGAKTAETIRPSFAYLRTEAGISDCIERLGFWPPAFLPRPKPQVASSSARIGSVPGIRP